MTSHDLDKCIVCGESTKGACSSCRKAGIDLSSARRSIRSSCVPLTLLYCSPQHTDTPRTRVWFVHKAVCGPGKANPFVWPAFTQAEVDLVKANPEAPFPGTSTPFLRGLGEQRGRSAAAMMAEIEPTLLCTNAAFAETPERQLIVSLARAFLFSLVALELSRQLGRRGDASHRSYVTNATAYDMSKVATLRDTENEPWLAGLSHRLVVYEAIVSFLHLPHEARPPGLEQHILAAVRNIHDFAAAEIAPTRPDLAGEVVHMFVLPS